MWREFREFLLKQNALALAIGVIVGAAIGKVVSSIASDLLMPVIGMALPGGNWREWKYVLSQSVGPDGKEMINSVNYGAFLGSVVDFAIVSFVVFLLVRNLLKPAPATPTKGCPYCLETVPSAATKCRACSSAL